MLDTIARMKYESTYCIRWASLAAVIWIAITLSCIASGYTPKNNLLLVYVGVTRMCTTFFNGCMVPFLTNVVRDHKCVEWDDMPCSLFVTALYKLFNGMHDIVNVLLITTLNWRVYLVLITSDVVVSCASTVRYVRAKRSASVRSEDL